MPDINWSSLENGAVIAFDPTAGYDVLRFDDPAITAGRGPDGNTNLDVYGDHGAGTTEFSYGGKTVTLQVSIKQLWSGNVTFASDSLFVYGGDSVVDNDDDANTLVGGRYGDRLIGAGGTDSIVGGAGDDFIVMIGSAAGGAFGSDTVDGGTGYDLLSYDDTGGIDANLMTGIGTGGSGGTFTLISIENVVGYEGDDTITGDDARNFLGGDGGADLLTGNGDDDILDGSLGIDTMIGGTGNDTYHVDAAGDVVTELSTQGTDTVISSVTRALGNHQENLTLTGSDAINGTGNELDNIIIGNGEDNVLIGGAGDDSINGGSGADTLEGNAGNDTLDGGSGDDSMIGGAGDDVYFVGNVVGQDQVVEALNEGIDTVFTQRDITLGANIENASWVAAGGGGLCRGNGLDNILTGIGQDVLMDGEGGIDTVSYAGETDSVTIDLVNGTVDAGGTDTLEEIENALGGLGDDSIIGDDVDNVLDGNAGADSLVGGYGDDTYVVDHVDDDVLESNNNVAPGGLVLAGPGGQGLAGIDGITDTVLAAINFSLANVNFVENVRLTGAATLATGNTLANELVGNSLSNTLSGAGGDDTLDGGTGNDTMSGGTGNDTYIVNVAGDVVTEGATGGGTDTVRASLSETLDANVETLVLTGASALNGTGNSLANRLTGNGAANRLSGLVGNDTLDGAGGNDTLDGGTGNDSMNGGAGNDVYIVDAATDKVVDTSGTDTVRSSVTVAALASGIENLLFTGAGAINGTGNASNNTITGNNAANVLNGGGGADNLNGGAGNDTLVWSPTDTYNGGAGTDTLRLAAGALNLKTIADTKILSVEKVDLKGDGNNTLTLARADVLAMSSTDTLTVVGDSGDRVTATGFTQIADLGAYNRYTSGAATLLVESDVTVVL